MKWQDAVLTDGICNRFGVANLEGGGEVAFTAAHLQTMLDAAVAAERERCIAECKTVAADVTDAAKMGAMECWRRLALGA